MIRIARKGLGALGKISLLLSICLVLVNSAKAQGANVPTYTLGINASFHAAIDPDVDFNGDGYSELVALNSYSLQILSGAPQANFAVIKIVPINNNPYTKMSLIPNSDQPLVLLETQSASGAVAVLGLGAGYDGYIRSFKSFVTTTLSSSGCAFLGYESIEDTAVIGCGNPSSDSVDMYRVDPDLGQFISSDSSSPGSPHYSMSYSEAYGTRFGASLAPLGFNSSAGEFEIFVGAPDHDFVNESQLVSDIGRVYKASFSQIKLFQAVAPKPSVDLFWQGSIPNARGGESIVLLNDIDGDGARELAVAEPDALGIGRVVVLSGSSGQTLEAIELPSTSKLGEKFLINLGDLNGDGVDDLAIPRANASTYVYSAVTLQSVYATIPPSLSDPVALGNEYSEFGMYGSFFAAGQNIYVGSNANCPDSNYATYYFDQLAPEQIAANPVTDFVGCPVSGGKAKVRVNTAFANSQACLAVGDYKVDTGLPLSSYGTEDSPCRIYIAPLVSDVFEIFCGPTDSQGVFSFDVSQISPNMTEDSREVYLQGFSFEDGPGLGYITYCGLGAEITITNGLD